MTEQQTARVWAWVAALLVLAGSGVAGLSSTESPIDVDSSWWTLPAFVALLVAATRLRVRIRLGREVETSNLVEAVLAPLIFFFPPVVVVAIAALAQALVPVVRRTTVVKATFNSAQWAVASAAGGATFLAVAGGPGLTLRNLAALVGALAVVAAVNHACVVVVLALARERSLRDVLGELRPVMAPAWVGGWAVNCLVGLLYVVAFVDHPAAVVLFAVPLGVLHLAYRGYAAARADHQRLTGLHRAARLLATPVDPREAVEAFLAAVATCFEARAAVLVLRTPAGREVHLFEPPADPEAPAYRLITQPEDSATFEGMLASLVGAVRVGARDDDPLAAAVHAAGWHECVAAPLVDEGRLVGAIAVLDQAGVEGSAAGEVAVLETLARETTGVFAKGRLVARIMEERAKLAEVVKRFGELAEEQANQRIVVEQLQQAVVPAAPSLTGVELAVEYVPSDPSAPTGGDLYDWQVLPDGDLHLAVIDVLGHGVAATKAALSVLHTLRVVVGESTPLEEIIGRADRVLSAQDPDLVATVLIGRYEPTTGRLRVVSGGHPPAVLVRSAGSVDQLAAAGGAIGWPGAGSDDVTDVQLGPGDTVIFYTDGLVEARKDLLAGMEELLRHAAQVAHLPADELAAALVGRALAGAQRRDDTLALVLRRTGAAVHLREHVAPTPQGAAQARHALARWLDGNGLVAEDAVLVAAELLSNAVHAARSVVTLTAHQDGHLLRLDVVDDGIGDTLLAERGQELPEDDAVGGRGLFLVRSLAERVSAMSTSEGTAVSCWLPLSGVTVVEQRRAHEAI